MNQILTLLVLALWGGSLFAQVVFTGSGTFVVPAGVTQITIEMIGAGGNGASNGGGGGGGGGYAKGTYTVVPGTSYPIVVGAGGSELATIAGGLGILAGAGENANTVPNPQIGGGGAGGVGMGGQVTRTGGAGGGGYWTYFGGGGGGAAGSLSGGGAGGNTIAYTPGNCLTPGGTGGTGGGGPAGAGGKGAGFVDNSCIAADPAVDGGDYGAGGGGGNGNSSPAAQGAGGICIITWSPVSGMVDPEVNAPVLVNNPFTDRIALRNVKGTERYELLDASGRMLWSGMNIGAEDFAHLGRGSYFLKVIDAGSFRTIRVVK